MNKEGSLRIVLADDHAMLREGLRRSLTAVGFEVVGEASDGRAAIDAFEQLQPDVVLMDVTMPVQDGIAATRTIVDRWPEAKIVILTMHADPQLAKNATTAGAMGYLVKDCTTEDIVSAIEAAVRGEQTFPSEASVAIERSAAERPVISHREKEVLQLIADGCSTTEAAQTLYVSVKTVKNHLASAYAKLDAHDRTQAVLRAARLGLITLRNQD